MKRKVVFNLTCICLICTAMLCAGCAAANRESDSMDREILTEDMENPSDTDNSEEPLRSSEYSAAEESDRTESNRTESNRTESSGTEPDEGQAVELTAEELATFTDFVNQGENNGFLLSQYDTVSAADLNQILYNGAGMESQLQPEEQEAYESAGYSVETDITRLTTEQIETFLQRKAGIGMADMTEGLDWVYLEEFDCYVFQHGDTNFCPFTCTSGIRMGEIYELRFQADWDYVPACVTTVKKNGNDYQFVSNRYIDSRDELDLSGLDEDTKGQLEVFAETKDLWIPQDYEPFMFGYTVHDLDGDGRMELLVQVVAGTGLFSENHFYQVNDAGDGIKELPQEFYDGMSELDIGDTGSQEQAFRDEDGVIYYMAADITRNGYAQSFRQDGAYCLKDGCVYSIDYRGLDMQAQGVDSWEETYYDADGNEISQEEWEQLRESFLRGKSEIPYTIIWASAYPEDVRGASVVEILQQLAECCKGM